MHKRLLPVICYLLFLLNNQCCFSQFNLVWTQTNDPGSVDDRINAIAVNASGVYVAGWDEVLGNSRWRIEKRDLNTGALIAAFGTAGIVTNNPTTNIDRIYAIAVDASGIYVAGSDYGGASSDQWRIEKRDLTTGALIAAFGTSGVVTNNPTTGSDVILAMTIDASGIYVAGYDNGGASTSDQWRIEKRDLTTGALVAAFGTAGVVISDPTTLEDRIQAITIDASGIYAAGYDYGGGRQWRIEKRDLTTGALVAAFGTSGVVTSNPSGNNDKVNAIIAPANGLYIGGFQNVSGSDYQMRIEKRDLTTGALVSAFGTSGAVTNNPSTSGDFVRALASNSTALYAASDEKSPGGGDGEWRIEELNLTNGSVLCTYTINPCVDAIADVPAAIAIDATGLYVGGWDWCSDPQWHVDKFDGCGLPLPVELLYFNAYRDGAEMRVRCEWSTATEIDNDYFAIERSTDAVTFEQIGTMQGAGNSSIVQNYVYYDNEPYYGLSYYRFRQVDFNGAFSYSNIEPVYIGKLEIVNIYPSFSDHDVSIVIYTEQNINATVEVFNELMQNVYTQTMLLLKGETEIKIPVSYLSSGQYMFRATLPSGEKAQKVFVH